MRVAETKALRLPSMNVQIWCLANLRRGQLAQDLLDTLIATYEEPLPLEHVKAQ